MKSKSNRVIYAIRLFYWTGVILVLGQPAKSQDSTRQGRFRVGRVYEAWVTTTQARVDGYLASMNDSAVLVDRLPRRLSREPQAGYMEVGVGDIVQVRIRRKNKVRRNTLLGLMIGAGTGAAVGYLTYSKPDPNNPLEVLFDVGRGGSTILGALTGMALGTLVGLVTATKTKFSIHADRGKFARMKAVVLPDLPTVR